MWGCSGQKVYMDSFLSIFNLLFSQMTGVGGMNGNLSKTSLSSSINQKPLIRAKRELESVTELHLVLIC